MAVVAQHGNPANTTKLFRKLNSIGGRDVRYWHKADMPSCPTDVCFGVGADIDQLLLKCRVASFH